MFMYKNLTSSLETEYSVVEEILIVVTVSITGLSTVITV